MDLNFHYFLRIFTHEKSIVFFKFSVLKDDDSNKPQLVWPPFDLHTCHKILFVIKFQMFIHINWWWCFFLTLLRPNIKRFQNEDHRWYECVNKLEIVIKCFYWNWRLCRMMKSFYAENEKIATKNIIRSFVVDLAINHMLSPAFERPLFTPEMVW